MVQWVIIKHTTQIKKENTASIPEACFVPLPSCLYPIPPPTSYQILTLVIIIFSSSLKLTTYVYIPKWCSLLLPFSTHICRHIYICQYVIFFLSDLFLCHSSMCYIYDIFISLILCTHSFPPHEYAMQTQTANPCLGRTNFLGTYILDILPTRLFFSCFSLG